MSLPPEVSAQLFKELGPQEVQDITVEISKLPQVPPEVRAQVIEEFLQNSKGGGGGFPEMGGGGGHNPAPVQTYMGGGPSYG